MNKKLHNEAELLEKIAGGNEEAFRTLFLFYRHRLYTVIVGMVNSSDWANDIYQDVFLKVWVKREQLPDVSNFAGWLFTIARNLVLDAYEHAETLKPNGLEIILGNVQDSSYDPADRLVSKEMQQVLSEAIGYLPQRQRETYELIKVEGMSRSEAAARMKISPETVKWNLEQAMRSIRAYCSKYISIVLIVAFTIITYSFARVYFF